MSRFTIFALTALSMIAFAGNSILCRLALKETQIDPATFTSIRILSGALSLWFILRIGTRKKQSCGGNWVAAIALVIYAVAISYAYISLSAATGALLLFGAVQITMIGYGLWSGERLQTLQWTGLFCALIGFIGLMIPGVTAPPLAGSIIMIISGVAWGLYSLMGKSLGEPILTTTGNFIRAIPIALTINVIAFTQFSWDSRGAFYAILSGALASGAGYTLWYATLKKLQVTTASVVQLSVPVITAIGGILLLNETMTLRLFIASAVILGGIALATRRT